MRQPDNIFHRDDELNLYFQIYSPGIDAKTGSPRLDVLYTFHHRQADGSLTKLGSYQVKDSRAQVQGYAVPLKGWLVGEYVVTVTVFDRARGVPVSSELEFVIR